MGAARIEARQFWPNGSWLPLLKAAYHSDQEIARASWKEWCSIQDFELAEWNQVRMTPVVRDRLPSNIFGELFPRLTGLRRFIWTQGSLRLTKAEDFLRKLNASGISILLLKGGARIASDPNSVAERSFADLDVLIKPQEWKQVSRIVFESGYTNVWGLSDVDVESRLRNTHHSIAIKVAEQMEVDLHQSSLLLNRQKGADDGLWERSRRGELRDIPVLIPHSSDLLAIILGHAFLYIDMPHYNWVGDALACLRSADFDWALFQEVVRSRELMVPALIGLSFIKDELAADIPSFAIESFASLVREPFVTEFKALHSLPSINDPNHLSKIYAAELSRAYRGDMAEGFHEVGGSGKKKLAEKIFTNTFIVPVPAEGKFDQAELDLILYLPHGNQSVDVSVRTFDFSPVELDRQQIGPEWFKFIRRSKMKKFSVMVHGAFIRAREIPFLKIAIWPSANSAPSKADRELDCNLGFSWKF